MKRVIKWSGIILGSVILLGFIALNIYASTYYEHVDAMDTAIEGLDTADITRTESNREIVFEVENPTANILFIPGGLVEPNAYEYLCYRLAQEGYQVTLFKPFYKLAILSFNYPARYIEEDLDNIIIGHSLGGVVASIVASGNEDVDSVILLGSYPIQDLSDKDVLFITAEHDDNMNQEEFNASLEYVSSDTEIINIDGGNHAQFGWYGEQANDGEAEISTITQQDQVITLILAFIE